MDKTAWQRASWPYVERMLATGQYPNPRACRPGSDASGGPRTPSGRGSRACSTASPRSTPSRGTAVAGPGPLGFAPRSRICYAARACGALHPSCPSRSLARSPRGAHTRTPLLRRGSFMHVDRARRVALTRLRFARRSRRASATTPSFLTVPGPSASSSRFVDGHSHARIVIVDDSGSRAGRTDHRRWARPRVVRGARAWCRAGCERVARSGSSGRRRPTACGPAAATPASNRGSGESGRDPAGSGRGAAASRRSATTPAHVVVPHTPALAGLRTMAGGHCGCWGCPRGSSRDSRHRSRRSLGRPLDGRCRPERAGPAPACHGVGRALRSRRCLGALRRGIVRRHVGLRREPARFEVSFVVLCSVRRTRRPRRRPRPAAPLESRRRGGRHRDTDAPESRVDDHARQQPRGGHPSGRAFATSIF